MPLKKKEPFSSIPLLTEWEEYLNTNPSGDLRSFGIWLVDKHTQGPASPTGEAALDKYFEENTERHQYAQYSSEAAFLFWRLAKFVRFHTRSVLLNNGLTGQDDFAILAHVDYRKECTKKSAIEANIIDPTTGIDIIRRMIRERLLRERVNRSDKREKLISLTAKGKKLMYAIYQGFATIPDLLSTLSASERKQLLVYLQKLDQFHTQLHKEILLER